jgi:hypothetical protein
VSGPGQLAPNELELATLERIAAKNPSLRPYFGNLHVLSRGFTGVGSYTNFRSDESSGDVGDQRLSLGQLIIMPKVKNGMGAILFCRGGQPKCLEMYTHGNDLWDGIFDGFVIEDAVPEWVRRIGTTEYGSVAVISQFPR